MTTRISLPFVRTKPPMTVLQAVLILMLSVAPNDANGEVVLDCEVISD